MVVDLENQAEGYVIVDLYRLEQGKTWPDLLSHFSPPGAFTHKPEWVIGMSGRDVRGDKYDRQYVLEPGIYGVVCVYMDLDTNGTWPAASIDVGS
ncbi:MAG: hypothetical protein ACE5JF_06805 [Anaerolineales bacterium]